MSQAKEASSAQRPRQYSLQEVPISSVRSLTQGSVLMLAVRFEEVVSKGAGAAVALFSGAVIREMYRTKILSVKVSFASPKPKPVWRKLPSSQVKQQRTVLRYFPSVPCNCWPCCGSLDMQQQNGVWHTHGAPDDQTLMDDRHSC